MKRWTWILAAVVTASWVGSAQAYTIDDQYIGADDHGYGDTIGNPDLFGVAGMNVTFESNGTVIVDVYSSYFDNIGSYNTELGDLFISTDGWTPYGSAPYTADDSSNGEDWEYALVLDDHTGGTTSGTLNLFATSDGNIVESWADPGYIWRNGQEVQLANSTNSLAQGTWQIYGLGTGTDTDDYLRFVIDYSDWGMVGSTMGFKWAMSCANDAIEGGTTYVPPMSPVPEPATFALWLSGLAGFGARAGWRRRKHAHSDADA